MRAHRRPQTSLRLPGAPQSQARTRRTNVMTSLPLCVGCVLGGLPAQKATAMSMPATYKMDSGPSRQPGGRTALAGQLSAIIGLDSCPSRPRRLSWCENRSKRWAHAATFTMPSTLLTPENLGIRPGSSRFLPVAFSVGSANGPSTQGEYGPRARSSSSKDSEPCD